MTKKTPPYYFFRILLTGFFIYGMLIFPYYSILRLNQFTAVIPETELNSLKNDIEKAKSGIHSHTKPGENIEKIFKENQVQLRTQKFQNILAVFLILLVTAANIPVKIYFRKKRKKQSIPPKISAYTKRYIRRLPLFNSAVLFLPLILGDFLVIKEIISLPDYPNEFLYNEKHLVFVHIIASLLTGIFIYYWQKNRLQFVYLEHIFPPEELQTVADSKHRNKVSRYFWAVNLITILFPIIMVSFYLSTSITQFSQFDRPDFSPEQKEILFNETISIKRLMTPEKYMKYGMFINADNTYIMLWGLLQSTISALIFLAFFITWSVRLVVKPINELLANMQATGKGNMGIYGIVRSNDEIGQLSAEYNNMSERLKNYFDEVNDLNKNLEQKVIERTRTISEQKEEIESQRDNLIHKNNEIEAQNEEIIQQRDILSDQKKEITDSIAYAQRIQNAVMPENTAFGKERCLVFFKPRDVVSGDFYYFNKKDKLKIFSAADCTGHGVPGAFMSMLGISFLNEIVQTHPPKASVILEELRMKVKKSLRQYTHDARQKDGMDMALCILNEETGQLQYAGAYNPLIIIRNQTLIEHKAVRNPIGIYLKEKAFQNIEIDLQKNDMVYLFSDGYPDQFGGKSGKKFKTKRFKELLRSIAEQSITQQKLSLEHSLEQWKGNYEQTDDIIIIGIRIE
jgi:serine phosphatase RsbU (regulator of sigma subunit)